MNAFHQHSGIIAPFNRDNVDTDLIIPKQYLTTIECSGLGGYLLDNLRFSDEGYLGKTDRTPTDDFILNQPGFTKSSILLATANFGCGSSREHAVWALLDYGFRVIIAESFADIFRNNCYKNGLLPIQLANEDIQKLFHISQKPTQCSVDLQRQTIEIDDQCWQFEIELSRKDCLLQGLDEIGVTLNLYQDAIDAYEQRAQQQYPWVFRGFDDT